MGLPAISLEPEALLLLENIKQKVSKEIKKSKKIPVSILLWGPAPDDPSEIAQLRVKLRSELIACGHLAQFSEELIETGSEVSVKTQQLIHAQQFDMVVSMPCTPGSIGELHDFISDNRINKKLLVFLNEDFQYGYQFQSVVATSSYLTYKTITYKGYGELYIIENSVNSEIQKIREIKYFNQGRWI